MTVSKRRKACRFINAYTFFSHFLFSSSCFHGGCHLPLDDLLREKLIDQLHVVRLEFLNARNIIALAVQIVRVESLHSLEHIPILITHELAVSTLSVPGVERMVTNHSQRLVRQVGLIPHHMVEVLIMAPAEHDIVESTALGIDAILGRVDRIIDIRVRSKRLGKDNALIERTPHGKCIAHNVPLALRLQLGEEKHQLAQIVDEAGNLHPAGLAVATNRLGGLQEVLDLGQAGVGVRFVDEGVELLHGLPDGHFGADTGRRVEAVAGREVVGDGLLGVLLGVEVLDAVACGFVLAEVGLVLGGVEFGVGVVFDGVDVVDEVRGVFEGGTSLEGLGGDDIRGDVCDG